MDIHTNTFAFIRGFSSFLSYTGLGFTSGLFSDHFILNLHNSDLRKTASWAFKGALWHHLSDLHRTPHNCSNCSIIHLFVSITPLCRTLYVTLLIYFTLSSYSDLLSASECLNSLPQTLLSPLPMLHRADRSLRISLVLMQNRHFSLFKCTLLAANASIFCAAKQIRNSMWLLAIFFFSQILPFWGLPVILGQSAPNKYKSFCPNSQEAVVDVKHYYF